jgi:hypothetical protein
MIQAKHADQVRGMVGEFDEFRICLVELLHDIN